MSDDGFNWYVSQDRERWRLADDATRAVAIDFGRQRYRGESFYVCEARHKEISLRVDHDDIFEWLERRNEDALDPEGDGELFDRIPDAPQCLDLETRIECVIRDWISAYGLALRSWAFADQRNEELIPDARSYRPDIRASYHALVARMGAPKEPRA